ncbi:HET-domain-containing protein [Imleria badia]|nr:HET-domain-containing protein [Imleria badia]
MRLLNSRSKQLELLHNRPPKYAIVSHRWGDESEEVLFTDIGDPARTQSKDKGYQKILGSCAQAVLDSLHYVWLDTCCIDKSNSTELGEAINSMYRWYHKSDVCYAYLHDVSDPSKFTESDWFSRGWTLQELIAPKRLKFFTRDWNLIGTREELIEPISERTGISPEILRNSKIPAEVTISQKMVWAAERETTKMEDRAYSLLGILGVSMVPIYGIDDGAFEDLQHRLIAKYADQTLFAWYHTVTEPDDVEMADADLASVPALEPAPESAESDTSTPSPNTTGLLASSPSQYLKSYEISEVDFRKNYVDGIRDHSYRSHFSISNNLVHISVPVKHMEGKIWKAVLRCSLEPPDGDQIQRPLVIYLEEIQPWKYLRVHLPRNEEEGEVGEEQTNDLKDIPGSLERLSDAELHLEGYVLRDIDVVGRHGDSSPDDQPRPAPEDPDALPELTEDQRIAQLPRHPPGVKTTNIIVCGEPGVAAGRVINLIIDDIIIKPLTDYDRETMAVTPIDATLNSRNIRIFYIIGPRDPSLDLETYHTAIRNMYQLVQHVKEARGVHLVLLCMVGSKVTAAVKSNYLLFHEYICGAQVPMMLIVTGLGKTKRMEDWWDKHKTDQELQAMEFLRHACITVLQGEDEAHEKKYEDSKRAVRDLLIEFMDDLETSPKVYRPEDVDRWFVFMGRRAMDLLMVGQKNTLKQEAIVKTLKEAKALKEGRSQKEWVNLTEAEASDLAGQFFDEHAMGL